MGLGMGLNLQKHLRNKGSPSLRYSNRSLSKGQPLKDAGAIPEDDFESAVQVRYHLYNGTCGCILFPVLLLMDELDFQQRCPK
jgi:hypothetical protein